jgi:hypothetical protein
MRALSLGLVKGSIDQVDKRVYITWVQPRVLDLNQVIFNVLILIFCRKKQLINKL